jgi:hypothetical protein
MPRNRKRPLGITLLALVFLWIGCFGTLIFPIILFTGGEADLAKIFFSKDIHSHALLLAATCVLNVVWFGLYVLYAFIGFGLWRLRKWSRKALIIITWIGIGLGFLWPMFYWRQPLLAAAICIWMVGVCSIFVWYLHRPIVLAAFGELLSITSSDQCTRPIGERWWKKTSVRVVGAFIIVAVLFATLLTFAVEKMFRSSDVYKITLQKALQSPCLANRLGTPITSSGMISGSMTTSVNDGSANLSIPVRGPKGRGNLNVIADKGDGSWILHSLILTQRGEEVAIYPNALSNCN